MNKPKTYDSYKKDKEMHRHDMTYEAHEKCEIYERFLLRKKDELDYEFKEYTIQIERVNGFIVAVETNMPIEYLVSSASVLSKSLRK